MKGRLLAMPIIFGCVPAAIATEVTAIQTDRSGGPGTQGPVLEWGAGFEAVDAVAWRAIPDQIALGYSVSGSSYSS